MTADTAESCVQGMEVAVQGVLEGVDDAVEFGVLGRVGADGLRGAAGMAVPALERGAVFLAAEPAEPYVRPFPGSAAMEVHGMGVERDADDPADGLEVVEDMVVPFVEEALVAIPGAGPLLRCVRKLVDRADRDLDDLVSSPADGRCGGCR